MNTDATTVVLIGGSTFAAGALLSLLLDRVREYLPGLHGRRMLAVVDGLSLMISALVLVQQGADWFAVETYLALVAGGFTLGIAARASHKLRAD